jgi:hypothetical protein
MRGIKHSHNSIRGTYATNLENEISLIFTPIVKDPVLEISNEGVTVDSRRIVLPVPIACLSRLFESLFYA